MSDTPKHDIVTLTINPCVDRCCGVDHVAPNRKLRCHSVTREAGGGGINVARAIQTLGGAPLALWAGGGGTGDLLGDLLDREQIVHRRIPIESVTRENINVLESSSGSQFRFGMPGAELKEAEVERVLEEAVRAASGATFFVASGSLPPGVDDRFYARLSERLGDQVKLIVDCSGEPLRRALEAGVYLIKPNFSELSDFAGRELENDSDIEAAGRQLIEDGGAAVVIVSLGSGGAMVMTATGAVRVHSPTVKIQSRIGAGDSMVAGVTLGLSRQWALSDAARFGVAAGAAAVMTPGVELCRRGDAEQLYEQMKDDQTKASRETEAMSSS